MSKRLDGKGDGCPKVSVGTERAGDRRHCPCPSFRLRDGSCTVQPGRHSHERQNLWREKAFDPPHALADLDHRLTAAAGQVKSASAASNDRSEKNIKRQQNEKVMRAEESDRGSEEVQRVGKSLCDRFDPATSSCTGARRWRSSSKVMTIAAIGPSFACISDQSQTAWRTELSPALGTVWRGQDLWPSLTSPESAVAMYLGLQNEE